MAPGTRAASWTPRPAERKEPTMRTHVSGGTMRRLLRTALALACGLFLASSVRAYDPPAPAPGAGINGTVHDLATAHNGMNYVAIPADTLQRVCIFCHAPHHTYRISPANGGPGAGVGSGPQAPDAFDYRTLWKQA